MPSTTLHSASEAITDFDANGKDTEHAVVLYMGNVCGKHCPLLDP